MRKFVVESIEPNGLYNRIHASYHKNGISLNLTFDWPSRARIKIGQEITLDV